MSTTRTFCLTLVLLAACGRDTRTDAPAAQVAPSLTAPRGPDHLVLRVPRTGGAARVFAYPKLDTVVWNADGAPAPARVLAFDDEAGSIAYVDAKGAPARIDFRQGTASQVTKNKLGAIASGDGSNIYGVAADGAIERYGPSGPWHFKPKLPAHALFPQGDATLLVLAQHGDSSVVWRLRPPQGRIADSVVLPRVSKTLRTQVGDRLYLAAGHLLTGVRTKTMQRTATISFGDDIEQLEATPSGDRVFVVIKGENAVQIVDRFRDAVSGSIDIGRHAEDLRVDPLGRYLLAKTLGSDSALVIALGTNRVVGAVQTSWRDDLPFVSPDGGIAVAQGGDVALFDGETLRPTVRVRGGAADFWYAFRWTGFRPRDARLDKPVQFGGPSDSTRHSSDSLRAAPADSGAQPPALTPAPAQRDSALRRPSSFTVSFAALLQPERARDLAATIKVNGEQARVVSASRDGQTIYRVVLGPYVTREEADRVGRESRQQYWVYEGGP